MTAYELSSPQTQTQVFEIVRENLVKFVPQVLSEEQKSNWKVICQDLHHVNKDYDFLDNVVTGDKTQMFEYHPENERQSSEWYTLSSPWMSKSKTKIHTHLL